MMSEHQEQHFEDFLQGKDELSRQLKSLTQPSPSAALDQLIQAKIAAQLQLEQLEVEQKTVQKADLKAPPIAPGFSIWSKLKDWWYLPVAVTAVLAISLTHNVQQGSENLSPAQPQQVAILGDSVRSAASNHQSVPITIIPPAPATAPALAPKRIKPIQLALSTERPVQAATGSTSSLASTSAPAPATAPAVSEVAKQAEGGQTVVITGLRTKIEVSNTNDGMVWTPATGASVAQQSAQEPQNERRRDISTIPVTRSPVPVLEMKAGVTRGAESERYTTAPISGASNTNFGADFGRVKAVDKVEEKNQIPAAALLWLQTIEKQIDNGKMEEALQEWGKFKQQYPNYVLTPAMHEKILILEKSKK
ncbi:MAG: hypothetical protein K2P84_14615 [Undibacterium sp.]|nr:hypothetical protein [Undibacterium sp.]